MEPMRRKGTMLTYMKNAIVTRMVSLAYKLLSFGLQLVGAAPPPSTP
jgi:hypothetical protein